MRTRVKICGLTRAEDAAIAASLGVDAVGLVFYPPSPRAVTPEQALTVVEALPPFVSVVALFVDEQPARIRDVIARVPVDLLQFHGSEPPESCGGYGRPWIKAVRMRDNLDLAALQRRYAEASALLLDAYTAGVPGGTGNVFDWARIPRAMAPGIVLAGGLDAENVEQAVLAVRPYAVDVSGGVERAKGIKDAGKMAAFMRGVRSGDDGKAGL